MKAQGLVEGSKSLGGAFKEYCLSLVLLLSHCFLAAMRRAASLLNIPTSMMFCPPLAHWKGAKINPFLPVSCFSCECVSAMEKGKQKPKQNMIGIIGIVIIIFFKLS